MGANKEDTKSTEERIDWYTKKCIRFNYGSYPVCNTHHATYRQKDTYCQLVQAFEDGQESLRRFLVTTK